VRISQFSAGDHLLGFLELDSTMAKEVAEIASRPPDRGNRLGGDIEGEQYDPDEARRAAGVMSAGGHGSRLGGSSSKPKTVESRRSEAAEAAQRRMDKG
jgi:hypothetical protein